MDRHLHIISFTVPYPVNYGGVFDIFHKIVALHKAGIKIHLHCFTQNNRRQPEIDKFCESIHYYPRKKGLAGASLTLPYIVSSRMDKSLWRKLEEDEYPVLIEGIHAAGWLTSGISPGRKVILRLHNVEQDYYRQLYLSTSSSLKKIYYHFETILLRKFEKFVAYQVDHIFAVSSRDAEKYKTLFEITNVEVLPVFTGFSNDTPPSGTGNFCLYHGNLSIPENEKAVAWLLQEVFSDAHIPVVIAGKNPSPILKQLIAKFDNARLITDPTKEIMHDLIAGAQCHVLPSFNNTGVKLKLINALFHGRHCIVNPAAVKGSGLEAACHIAHSPQQFIELTRQLFEQPLSDDELMSRKKILKDLFDEEKNCETLIRWIW
ncbi:MAG: glycosyltransferase [Chitinophagaceae bacterium]|nr:glycosyltransferase [Chitinophagaceae bacterium]